MAALATLSHSLGKLIEWKPIDTWFDALGFKLSHSLGKLIEWKLLKSGPPTSGERTFPFAGKTN